MDIDTTDGAVVANHHADYPEFSGLGGYFAALTMAVGRSRTGRLAAKLTDLAPDENVVDLGCGPGAAARLAAALGARVTGVDPSTEMLRVARTLSRDKDIWWVEGRAEALPLPDDGADVVWALATVHHWPDLPGGLAEVRRVLRPGGRFVAIERKTRPGATGLASHGWSDAQVARFMQDCRHAGFTVAEASVHDSGRGQVQAVTAVAPS